MIPTIWLTRIVFILGVTNIISILLVRFTCRCIGSNKLTLGLFKYKWYQKIYSYHCLYWWIFIVSVIIHATFAIMLIGVPFG